MGVATSNSGWSGERLLTLSSETIGETSALQHTLNVAGSGKPHVNLLYLGSKFPHPAEDISPFNLVLRRAGEESKPATACGKVGESLMRWIVHRVPVRFWHGILRARPSTRGSHAEIWTT